MIRKYEPADFKYLESWVPDAALLFQFSGPDWSFPLTAEQVEKHRAADPQRCMYVGLSTENEPFAIGEIIWNQPGATRLGRILIGDTQQRGRGLGTLFVQELLNETISALQPEKVFLYVLEGNAGAIRCYEKIGFRFVESGTRLLPFQGKDWQMFQMVYTIPQRQLKII